MIPLHSIHSHSTPFDPAPLKLSQLNRTGFVMNEGSALLQSFQAADWATQWATLCFMKHCKLFNTCADIHQAAQQNPLLAGSLANLPPLDFSCSHVCRVLNTDTEAVAQAFGAAFEKALDAALNVDTDDQLKSCLDVLSVRGLSGTMKDAVYQALANVSLNLSGMERLTDCVPEGVRLLDSIEKACVSHLSLDGSESDLTPPSMVTHLSISPMSHNGTFLSFGQAHNGLPITPISQAGSHGNSFRIALHAMHDPDEIAEEEKKSASPRFGPL